MYSDNKAIVTVFSSIDAIAKSIRDADPNIPLVELIDTQALTGYGGTVTFDAKKLQTSTKQKLSEAEVLITEPYVLAGILSANPNALPNLKWCQSTYAGVDPLFNAVDNETIQLKTLQKFQLTRFAGKFGMPITEWCIARIINHERNFEASKDDQKRKLWAGSKEVNTYRYLCDISLTILGCGDIGLCIGKTCKNAFGMNIIGYTRRPSSDPNYQIDGWEMTNDLNYALQKADYVISILPSTPKTRDFLSNDVLKVASLEEGGKCPVFINVGRGDVISDDSLITALENKFISKAILDVFNVEPLPSNHPLWGRQDVIISPHVSGVTRSDDVPDVFVDNYQRYVSSNQPLQFVVDWNKGY